VASASIAIATLPFARREAALGGAAFRLCARQSISLLGLICACLWATGYELSEVAAPTFCARISKALEGHPICAMKLLLACCCEQQFSAGMLPRGRYHTQPKQRRSKPLVSRRR
jgi:hypothetical protein